VHELKLGPREPTSWHGAWSRSSAGWNHLHREIRYVSPELHIRLLGALSPRTMGRHRNEVTDNELFRGSHAWLRFSWIVLVVFLYRWDPDNPEIAP